MTKIDKIINFCLVLFVLTIPLTNRDIFSFGPEFLIPVRSSFLLLITFTIIKVYRNIRHNPVAEVKAYITEQKKDKIVVLLGLLWLVRVASIVNSLNLVASFSLLFFYTSMILLYLILKQVFSTNMSFALRLMKLYFLVVALSALYALSQVLLNMFFGITLPGLLVGGNYYRVPGPFYDANHLPPFLVTGIPSFVALGWYFDKDWKRVLMFTLATVCSYVLFLTFSRSGYLAFAVSIFISMVLLGYYRYWRKLLLPILLVVFLSVIVLVSDFTSHSILKRFYSVSNTAEKSTIAHALLLQGEIDLFLKNPMLGVGYGSFSEHFRASKYGIEHLKIDPTENIRLPAHSIWFEVLAETGLFGIVLYVLLMSHIVKNVMSAVTNAANKEWRVYFIAILASCVGALFGGVFYSYNLEFFWFFLFSSVLLTRYYKDLKLRVNSIELRESEKVNWVEILIPSFLVLIGAIVIFYRLGVTTLIDFDEAIYASIAKRMAFTGNYLIPYFNDFNSAIPWLEKPPLYMWLSAILVKLMGIDSFPVRFWSAFFGVGGVLICYLITRRWFSKFSAFCASLVLLTTFHYLRYSKMAMTDITLTFFMCLSLYLVLIGNSKKRAFLAGLALGLAFMTKGVVSLLALPPIVLLAILRDSGEVKESLPTLLRRYVKSLDRIWLIIKPKINVNKILIFTLGFGLMVLPWHLYIYSKFGKEFVESYFGYHVAARFSSDLEGKTEPFFTYVAVIRNSLRIWFPLLPLAGVYSLYILLKKSFTYSHKHLLLVVWALAIFIPLSAAHSKLIWYIVPIYPVIAIIIGVFIDNSMSLLYQKIFNNLHSKKILVFGLIDKDRPAKIAYFFASLVLIAASFTYLIVNWKLVEGEDFNRSVFELTRYKEQIEPTGKFPIAYMGVVGHGFARFYPDGRYEVWPSNLVEGVLAQAKTRYLVVEKNNALDHYRRLNKIYPMSIVGISGNMLLIKTSGSPVNDKN